MLLFHTGRRMEGRRLLRELTDALCESGTPAQAIHAIDKDHAGINTCIGQPDDRYTHLIMQFLDSPRDAGSLRLAPADNRSQ